MKVVKANLTKNVCTAHPQSTAMLKGITTEQQPQKQGEEVYRANRGPGSRFITSEPSGALPAARYTSTKFAPVCERTPSARLPDDIANPQFVVRQKQFHTGRTTPSAKRKNEQFLRFGERKSAFKPYKAPTEAVSHTSKVLSIAPAESRGFRDGSSRAQSRSHAIPKASSLSNMLADQLVHSPPEEK